MQAGEFPYQTGVIHGRFQVLHNDHLKYLMAGKALCRHLVVGITNPEPLLVKSEAADPHRSDPLANPLTYYERYLLVKATLAGQGLQLNDFSIVPLPINLPERYRHYVPLNAVYFLSIYDDWGERKHHYFRSQGLQTHILRKVSLDEKGISASEVRGRMADGETWAHLVPPPVARLLEQWGLPDRLRKARIGAK